MRLSKLARGIAHPAPPWHGGVRFGRDAAANLQSVCGGYGAGLCTFCNEKVFTEKGPRRYLILFVYVSNRTDVFFAVNYPQIVGPFVDLPLSSQG